MTKAILLAAAVAAVAAATTGAVAELTPSSSAFVLTTYGQARVHHSESSDGKEGFECSYKQVAKYMTRSLGVAPCIHEETDLGFTGDLFHPAKAGVFVILDGLSPYRVLNDPEYESLHYLKKALSSTTKSNTVVVVDGDDFVHSSDVVANMIKPLQKAFPNSFIATAGNMNDVDMEVSSRMWENLANVLNMTTTTRVYNTQCVKGNCKTEFVSDFGSSKRAKGNVELNVAVYKKSGVENVKAEFSIARKVVSEYYSRSATHGSDESPDLLVISFRLAKATVQELEYVDSQLPILIQDFAAKARNGDAVSQIFFQSYRETMLSMTLQRRRAQEQELLTATEAYAVFAPFGIADYILMSWTVVAIAIMLLILFLCCPWSTPLDPILRTQVKNSAEDKD